MNEIWIIRDDSHSYSGDIYAAYQKYDDALHDFKVRCEEMCAEIQNEPWDSDKENSQFAITGGNWYIILEPVQFV